MPKWHLRSSKKPTGGALERLRKKMRMDLGREPTATTVGEKDVRIVRGRGGKIKLALAADNMANILDTKAGQYKKAKIITVLQTPANPHFARRNIMTRGSIIKTELGDAVVTSRPGQDGVVNARLVVSEKKAEKKG